MAKKSKSTPEEKARHLWACSVRRMTDDQLYDTYHDLAESEKACQAVAAKALEDAAALQARNTALNDENIHLRNKLKEVSAQKTEGPGTPPKDAIRAWLETEAVKVKGVGPKVLENLLARLEDADEKV